MDKSIEQKEQIAEVFQRHFNHFGFKKTSVDDIAREIKMSKKTIYKHFSSKEKIFYFIVSKVARKYSREMEKKLVPFPFYHEKINHLTGMIFSETRKWLKDGNDAFEFKYKYNIARLAFTDAYNDIFKELLEQGNNAGEFHIHNTDIMVRFINGIISESMKLVTANPDLKVEDDVIVTIGNMITK
ncbi:MAG: TetR/AcrR family transcriptional regulator [Prolixibacteraceae bacterium]|nr:TetR/AcrR family transcriptional regulator [Prolixibacteraceae bacterium]